MQSLSVQDGYATTDGHRESVLGVYHLREQPGIEAHFEDQERWEQKDLRAINSGGVGVCTR